MALIRDLRTKDDIDVTDSRTAAFSSFWRSFDLFLFLHLLSISILAGGVSQKYEINSSRRVRVRLETVAMVLRFH